MSNVGESIDIIINDDPSVNEQAIVLMRALTVYDRRHQQRGDLWKLHGWRGMLHDLRVCTERAWHTWFSAPTHPRNELRDGAPELDELLDAINYAAMAVRAIEEDNRDGTGGWWNDI